MSDLHSHPLVNDDPEPAVQSAQQLLAHAIREEAYARGVADGLRQANNAINWETSCLGCADKLDGLYQATEGWDREWAVNLGGSWPMHPCDSEGDARRVAANYREGRTIVSRLVGPWEPDDD